MLAVPPFRYSLHSRGNFGVLTRCYQIASSINTREWQHRQSLAAEEDRRDLILLMEDCQSNQNKLYELLCQSILLFLRILHSSNIVSQQVNIMAIMAALDRQSQQSTRSSQELAFIKHSLSAMQVWSGRQPRIEKWTISPIEVDKSECLGSGGLWVSSLASSLLSSLIRWLYP
jgi:hypothetical protein